MINLYEPVYDKVGNQEAVVVFIDSDETTGQTVYLLEPMGTSFSLYWRAEHEVEKITS